MASDVKWIKITTDVFDDEKILLIESLPDAYAIIVVWFKLLCLAGKQNNSGVFLMGKIAYTDKMLATIFRMKESTVQLALQTFEQFGMIEIIDGVITIPNWGKHQNLEQIEARKEYQREYQREYRKKQKLLAAKDENEDSKCLRKHLHEYNVNSLEEDIERDIEKELDNKDIIPDSDEPEPPAPKKSKPVKHKYGEYQHVLLSHEESRKLEKEFGTELIDKAVTFLDEYIEMKGYKAKSHYLAIRKWVIDAVKEKEQKQNKSRKEIVPSWLNKGSFNNYDQRQYDNSKMSDLERKMMQKTAGNNPDIAARAEALKKQLS